MAEFLIKGSWRSREHFLDTDLPDLMIIKINITLMYLLKNLFHILYKKTQAELSSSSIFSTLQHPRDVSLVEKHSAVNIISTAVINTQATKTKRSVYFPFFQVWTAADAVFSNTEKSTLSKSTGNRRKVLFSVPLFWRALFGLDLTAFEQVETHSEEE